MKIVKLKGGLGNQMFQYAFAKLLEKKTSDKIVIDSSYYNNIGNDKVRKPRILNFTLSLSEASPKEISSYCFFTHEENPLTLKYKIKIGLEGIFNSKYFFEKNRAYIDINKILKYMYFDGYWQSWRYIEEVKTEIANDFKIKNSLSSKSQLFLNKIKNENAVFIGVRKGDYSKYIKHYGSFSQVYYDKCIRYILDNVESPKFYVFSDDIDYVKKNMTFHKLNVFFRNNEDVENDFEELVLMSNCKHAIIVNSTFNWWGAYLIHNKDKIVCCPQKWFFDNSPIDILPSNWVKIQDVSSEM